MRRVGAACWIGPLLLVAGCGHVPGLDRALLADRNPASHRTDLNAHYIIRCPDILALEIEAQPTRSGDRTVAADGRIHLDDATALRVDGMTVAEAGRSIADRLGLESRCVQVRVAQYRSQQIYVFGEVTGLQQAVAYQGPETVLDLLQRVGGITQGAAPRDVQVVRAHVADGRAPEIFEVDLPAIVLHKQQRTNITLQPFDKVYIAQTRGSKVSRCMPPWIRSLFSREDPGGHGALVTPGS